MRCPAARAPAGDRHNIGLETLRRDYAQAEARGYRGESPLGGFLRGLLMVQALLAVALAVERHP